MELNLSAAEKIIDAAKEEALKIGVPMTIAIVDHSERLVCLKRMDGVLPISIELAPQKAYTAVVLEMPTAVVNQLVQPDAELYGLESTCEGIVAFGGGVPFIVQDEVIGAIGVSGGSVAEDKQVAKAGIDFFKQRFTT